MLAFTSDIHNNEDNIAANRLDAWLDKMEGKYGDIDVMSFCGDMGSARAKENEFWAYTKSVMNVVSDESIEGVYTTGNHEFYNGLFSETENAVRGIYKVGAVGAESSNYIIYCLGTDNWDDRKDNYPESQIESMTDCLNNTGNDKPIIILTHFPLHAFDSGRMVRYTANAGLVIDALNKAADSGKSKNSDGPKTGDSGYAFYLMLLIGSAAARAAMLAARALSFTRSRR
ncbi:MAG: metallophosphoesterase [Mogibacterium sp.]|nr:metallophosphoesterase [Mogibacterium sp.]